MTKFKLTPIKIKGDKFLDAKAYARAIENTLTQSALAAKADFGVTTQTWKHKPKFDIDSKEGARVVGTNDEIYQYVDEGTRAHEIRARNAKRLAFRRGYSAKTSPRSISSRAGGGSGDWAYAKVVRHPGTRAREFADTIAKKWDKELPVQMQRAIDAESD